MTNFLGYITGGTEIASEETIRQQALIRAAADRVGVVVSQWMIVDAATSASTKSAVSTADRVGLLVAVADTANACAFAGLSATIIIAGGHQPITYSAYPTTKSSPSDDELLGEDWVAYSRRKSGAGRPRSNKQLDHIGEVFLTRWQPVAGYVVALRRDGATLRYIREAVRVRFGRVASHETIRKIAQYAEKNPSWVKGDF